MQMTEADINRLNQMRLSESFDPSMLLGDTPVSSIEPISPMDMEESFGGPLYQMMNPSGRKIVDALGMRGEGIGGFLEAMAAGPGKVKAVGKGIASLPMKEKIIDKVFADDKSLTPAQSSRTVVEAKLQKVIENSSFFDPKERIGKQTLINKAKETSPASAKIIEELAQYVDSPGADHVGDPYFARKIYESNSVPRGLDKYNKQFGTGQYDMGMKGGNKYVSDVGTFPNAKSRFYNKAEATSYAAPGTPTTYIGKEDKPFFVDPKKLADKLTMSGSGADFFKIRGKEILEDDQFQSLTQSILSKGYLNRPIDINITPLGYAHLSEGNHRLAKALAEGYKEIPVQFRYSAGAERVNHDFAINKLDQFLAPGSTGFKTKKEFDDFAKGIYNKAMTKENETIARGLIATDKIGKPAFRATDELQKQLDEVKMLYNEQRLRFFRAKDVEQSALRDGYLPDIKGSQKIMKNANEYGKQLKAEMDALEDMISNVNT
jgi:hypothetical protein